jgi:hypothetical protein
MVIVITLQSFFFKRRQQTFAGFLFDKENENKWIYSLTKMSLSSLPLWHLGQPLYFENDQKKT